MKKRNLIILTMLLCFIATIGWATDLQKGTDALENDINIARSIGQYIRRTPNLQEEIDAGRAFSVALIYYYGKGDVPKDYEQAVKWFTLAAEQESPPTGSSQYSLGMIYYYGEEGVPQNYRQALKWFTLAAERGHADAQFILGQMYSEGEGVPQYYAKAYMWGNIAASNGLSPSLRDHVSNKMTPSQLEKAQQMSSDCVAANYEGC